MCGKAVVRLRFMHADRDGPPDIDVFTREADIPDTRKTDLPDTMCASLPECLEEQHPQKKDQVRLP